MTHIRRIIEQMYQREFMPQVHSDDLPDAIKLLKSNNIDVELIDVHPIDLKHSQTGVNKEKVKAIVKDIRSGKKMPPIIVSSSGHIIDGHHRWIAYKVLEHSKIKAIRINLDKDAAIRAYKQIESNLDIAHETNQHFQKNT